MRKDIWLALCLVFIAANTVIARESVTARPTFQGPSVLAVKEEWGAHMRQFAQTGDRTRIQSYATELLENSLKGKGGFQKHFPSGFALEVTKGNIGKVIRLATASQNANMRIGYMREVKYLNGIALDGRFRIDSNSDLVNRGGKWLEFDATLQHKVTGERLRLEIKDVKVRSSNIAELKSQIERLGAEAKRSGERQSWVNRKAIPDAYRGDFIAHAEKHGVKVYDNISTGRATVAAGKAKSLGSVLAQEEKELARIASRSASRQLGRTVGRWGGRVGGAVSVGVFAYSANQWRRGTISTQEFAAHTAGAAGGALGAWGGAEAGAAAGALIGSVIPGLGTVVGGVVGGIVGGISGGFAGSWAGEHAVNLAGRPCVPTRVLVEQGKGLDRDQSQELLSFLTAHYAAR